MGRTAVISYSKFSGAWGPILLGSAVPGIVPTQIFGSGTRAPTAVRPEPRLEESMEERFCQQCGAKRAEGAHFCIECGASVGKAGAAFGRGFPMDRYAPLLVVGVLAIVAGVVIQVGMLNARPSPSLPARGGGGSGGGASTGTLPQGHPPIKVEDTVRQKIAALAADAAAKPEDTALWKDLGEMQYSAGQVERTYLSEAQLTFEHVVEKNPQDLDALRSLGNIAYDKQEPQKAIGYYEKVLAQRPDDLSVATDLGTMYLAVKDMANAIRVYEKVLAMDGTFFQAQFNLAVAYRNSGQKEKEMAALTRAQQIAPDAETREEIGRILQRVSAAAAPGDDRPASAPAAGGGFKDAVESIFRSHPILEARIDRIDWSGENAKVLLRDFPMEQMPDDMKDVFRQKLLGNLKEKKSAFQVAGPVQVDLVDSASGEVMMTLGE